MNLNDLLVWFVFGVTAMTLLQALIRRDETLKQWVPLHLGVAAATAASLFAMPDDAGYFGFAVYLVMIGFPVYIQRQLRRLVLQQRYQDLVIQLPRLMWMHPQRRQLQQMQEVWEALANAQNGRLTQARWQLRALSSEEPEDRVTVVATWWRYALAADWDSARHWFEEELSPDQRALPFLWVRYLRCLGECGDLAAMVESHAQFLEQVSPYDRYHQQLARLTVLAFCGRADLVPMLIQGPLHDIPWYEEQYWLAIAHQAAGAHLTASHLFTQQHLLPDPLQEAAVTHRMVRPVAQPGRCLRPDHWQHLRHLERMLDHQVAESVQLSAKPGAAGILQLLIGINIAMFLLTTVLGSSFDPITLERLGALVTPLVIAGEWWRTLTATFLHQGLMHLGVNMFGLYILGMYVISVMGKRRFLAIYFGAGVGGMALVTLINHLRGVDQLVIGASAGVMGLLTAVAVITWRHWREGRQPETRLRLILLLTILFLQAILDATTPEVSSLAHLCGASLGAFLALLLGQPALTTAVSEDDPLLQPDEHPQA